MFYPYLSVCPSRLKNLYNQLLLQFLSSSPKTLHKCFRHIEDEHLPLWREKIIFDKITAFLDFDILQFLANTLWKVCIINSSYSFQAICLKLLTNITGILKMCISLLEEKKNNFCQNYSIFGL